MFLFHIYACLEADCQGLFLIVKDTDFILVPVMYQQLESDYNQNYASWLPYIS